MNHINALMFFVGCIACMSPIACLHSVVVALAVKASVAQLDGKNRRICLILRQFCLV